MTLYSFDHRPDEPTRLAVCEWLTRHGIDPNLVTVPGWIETWPGARQITYSGFVCELVDGKRVPKIVHGDFERVERVMQLESPPLPFPV